MQTKTKNTYSENFLNNQNYILGKSEKKKLLSKFFVEKNFHNLFQIMVYISNNIYGIFFITISIIVISYMLLTYGLLGGIKISFFYFIFLILFLINVKKNIKKDNDIGVESFFINKEVYKSDIFDKYFFQLLFNLIAPFLIIYYFMWNFFPIILLGPPTYYFSYKLGLLAIFIQFVIPFTLLKSFKKTILGINYFNIIIFPLVILYQIFFTVFSLIYTYIFRGIKGYIFKKYDPVSSLLKKFEVIDNIVARNEFYEIKLK